MREYRYRPKECIFQVYAKFLTLRCSEALRDIVDTYLVPKPIPSKYGSEALLEACPLVRAIRKIECPGVISSC